MSVHNNRFTTTSRRPSVENNLSIFILGAGLDYRSKSYGSKALYVMPNGQSLIEYQITQITKCFPKAEIITTVGFEADKVIKKIGPGIHIAENQLYETTTIVEEVRLASNIATNTNYLFFPLDTVFNQQTLQNFNTKSHVIIDSGSQMPSDEVGATVINDEISIFSYGINTKFSGIVFISDGDISSFKNIVADRTNSKKCLFEIMNIFLEKNKKLLAIEPVGKKINKVIL